MRKGFNLKSKMKNKITLSIILALTLNSGLALAFDDPPLFVTITSDCCYSCKKLKPVLEELQTEYDGQITFVTLYVSSREQIEESKQKADEYGISEYFNSNKGVVPKVAILCPGTNKTNREFIGEIRKEIYKQALDELLLDTSRICSL